jgi:hypothetical protein
MSLEATHPLYDQFKDEWITMRDLFAGERAVKLKGEVYLPPTPGMIIDGMGVDKAGKPQTGAAIYKGYKVRAVFPDYVKDAVEALVGMMHLKPATFEVPDPMKPLLEKATLQNESLLGLLRRINTEQLLTGRVGLLADLPEKVDTLTPGPDGKVQTAIPYIASYIAESIINWDEADEENGYIALNLVVLNEGGHLRQADGFTWKTLRKFRVLILGNLVANENDGEAKYSVGVYSDVGDYGSTLAFDATLQKVPTLKGKELDEIPFVFINTKDIIASPDDAPLTGLGKLCLAIYRGEADYRQNLHMQGQDTLVVVGGTRNPDGTPGEDDALRTGAGARIDVDINGDAKFIGVQSEGLAEQREALVNDKTEAQSKAGKLIPVGKDAESGEALRTRVMAQTATLTQIVTTGARGLENLLKLIARWMGLDDSKVKVTPNMEFGDFDLGSDDFLKLIGAKNQGLPISRQSLHEVLVERGLTKMSFEEEMSLIEEENASMPPVPGSFGGPNPAVDPHLTNPDGTPMNKDKLQQASEQRQAARDKATAAAAKKAPKKPST